MDNIRLKLDRHVA